MTISVAMDTPGMLADSNDLLDVDWAWRTYCQQFRESHPEPMTVRVVEHTNVPGRRARASYDVEWPEDAWVPNVRFTLQRDAGKPPQIFRYPDDPELPGLPGVANPETALTLVKNHVMTIPPRRIRVETVRYRAGSHAVLRHRLGRARFYVRAMRPAAMSALLQAARLVARSNFAVPRIAGTWNAGAVIWTSEIPGRNLRQFIRAGKWPDPEILLHGLVSLWDIPSDSSASRPFDLAGRYRGARREIEHAIRDCEAAGRAFNQATAVLDPFNRSWQPVGTAHNDFYDDQLLVLPDGRMALVDFEEAGPGDPMLDVGNFLAHLNWDANMGSSRRAGVRAEFRDQFKRAALNRFGWDERELALREATCLFRICVFPVTRPHDNRLQRLEDALALVNETLC